MLFCFTLSNDNFTYCIGLLKAKDKKIMGWKDETDIKENQLITIFIPLDIISKY